jgi:hypothetical protein
VGPLRLVLEFSVSIYGGGGGRRRDTNEAEVIEAFEFEGCSVKQLTGKDTADLLVGLNGYDHQVEVKSRLGKMSSGQAQARQLWLGAPIEVVRSAAEAHALAWAWRSTQEPGRREPFTRVEPETKTPQRARLTSQKRFRRHG